MAVQQISQREMRNNSGEVLRRVAAGESFLVTDNGKPAAVLSPPPQVPQTRHERLVAQRRLVPPRGAARAVRVVPTATTLSVEQVLREDRDG